MDPITANYAKRKKTFVLTLTLPDLAVAIASPGILRRISYGADVWELRVDLLQAPSPSKVNTMPSLCHVASQVDFLQSISDLPIVFTIRTVSQGGSFPDDSAKEALELMLMAVEKECAYIDVEFTWPAYLIEEISRRKENSKLIASFHETTGNLRWTCELLDYYLENDKFGGTCFPIRRNIPLNMTDILKLSLVSRDDLDCHELASFMRSYQIKCSKPIIAVASGIYGRLSRVASPISFVTHTLIASPTAPEQMSLAETHQSMHVMGLLPRRDFYIIGNNISHSLSPAIHNAAFAELGLPHNYSIHQTPQIDDSIQEMLCDEHFGGASVTYPHKLNIQPLLDSVSVSAMKIGAVNTVVVEDSASGRVLRGDNTDWLGILQCIKHSMITCQTAVVVGAGGAARAAVFALQHLGVQRIAVVNRTRSTAERLAADFSGLRLELYQSMNEAPAANIIIGCIPADDVREDDIPSHLFADGEGLVIEMAYRPPVTALMRVGKRHVGWTVLGGVDILKEQAYAQFQLWTGRKAPVLAILEALERENVA
jgi:pentafunctional AROM polypeptide